MINLAVINLKDIIKILKKIIIIFFVLLITTKICFESFKKLPLINIKEIFNKDYSIIIDKNILISNYFNTNLKENSNKRI